MFCNITNLFLFFPEFDDEKGILCPYKKTQSPRSKTYNARNAACEHPLKEEHSTFVPFARHAGLHGRLQML